MRQDVGRRLDSKELFHGQLEEVGKEGEQPEEERRQPAGGHSKRGRTGSWHQIGIRPESSETRRGEEDH